MKNSVRLFVLTAALSFSAMPGLNAEQTGCNPHPQAATTAGPTHLEIIAYTVLCYFGM